MKKKHLEDPPRHFRGPEPVTHGGRIGPGSKSGPKRAVNVSIDAAILKVAKELDLNLSQVLEDSLRKATEGERARRFYNDNKASFDAHNAHIERNGTLAENYYGSDAFDDPAV